MKRPTKLRVLYVEDDDDSRVMVTFMLAQSNIEVVVADTISEAMLLANTQTFDLYLLDGLIHDGNGLDLCRDLHKYAPYTPILFYSGMAYQADIRNGLAAGANAYLVKPYFGDLSETILETVRNAETVPFVKNRFVNNRLPSMFFELVNIDANARPA